MAVRRRLGRPVVVFVASKRKLALALALVLASGLAGGSLAGLRTLPAVSSRLAGRVVGLDPGHGSVDSGATHPASPLAEKEITLDVGRRLARLIRREGGKAVLTRTDDWESDLPDRAELRRRAAIAEQGRAEILLSLHVDHYSDPTCRYAQVYYHPSSPEGKRLALALEAEFLRLQPDSYRRATARDYFLLGCTSIPSVLVELGFISNPDERRLLNEPGYREELAEALLRGIVSYFTAPRSDAPPAAPEAGANSLR